jgi:hypothetical protein
VYIGGKDIPVFSHRTYSTILRVRVTIKTFGNDEMAANRFFFLLTLRNCCTVLVPFTVFSRVVVYLIIAKFDSTTLYAYTLAGNKCMSNGRLSTRRTLLYLETINFELVSSLAFRDTCTRRLITITNNNVRNVIRNASSWNTARTWWYDTDIVHRFRVSRRRRQSEGRGARTCVTQTFLPVLLVNTRFRRRCKN